MIQEAATFLQALFDLVLWVIIVIVLSKANRRPYKLSHANRVIGVLLLLLFCVYAFWGGDYFHSIESYNRIKQGAYSSFEDVYKWIVLNLSPSYTFFRILVWGTGLALLLNAYKRIGANYDLSLFLFGALYLPLYSYARASVAMSLIVLGITLIYKPKQSSKFFSQLLGFVLVVCSVFFHRSAVVGVLSVLVSFFLINNKKWKLLLLGIIFPIGVFFMSQFLEDFMMFDLDSIDETISLKADAYLNSEDQEQGVSAIISNFLTRAPMFLTALIYIIIVFKGEYNRLSVVEKAIGSYIFIIMLISFSFLFDLGYNTTVLYYRILQYAMPANAIFLMSIKSRGLHKGLYNIVFWMALIASFYSLLYSTYCGLNKI